jgi:hypothetical protein
VPDVEDLNSFLSFQHAIDHTINMRLVAIQQVPELTVLRCGRAAMRMFFQTKDGLLEAFVPAPGSVRVRSVDVLVQLCKVSLRTGRNAN